MSKSNQTICHICFSPFSETMIECSQCGLLFHQETCGRMNIFAKDKKLNCKKCHHTSEVNSYYTKSENLKTNLSVLDQNINKLYSDTEQKIQANIELVDSKIQELYLKNEQKHLEIQKKLAKIKPSKKKIEWIYLAFLFIVFIPLTGFLVYKGWADKPEVTIDFSIGEIIGGILIGGGAIIAGTAYSRSVSQKEENNTNNR